ncbi:hypothetical protein CLOLEP_01091 [[Clostridium] leptum DSM 753]|uniref:Uncharacterized protein n=1 Tax=[Clostridium] leptum DSM 753 TaxID=428125 RepID=A7VRA8_9FIRM|nr:hypothetical protein CLOLEP_01091 [[Clostridium] leptum DSM 753]
MKRSACQKPGGNGSFRTCVNCVSAYLFEQNTFRRNF